MIMWLIFALPLMWLVVFKYRRRRMYKLAKLIPGPDDELPVIGIAHKLTGNTEDIMRTLQRYSYESMKNNGIIKGWLGHILYFGWLDLYDKKYNIIRAMSFDDVSV